MKATITSIKLKSPYKFFPLSWYALKIVRQLGSSSGHLEFRKRGFWMTHYTMSLWKNEEDLKKFAATGAHLEAMKKSKEIAREIRTMTIDTEELPSWKMAKNYLKRGKVIRF